MKTITTIILLLFVLCQASYGQKERFSLKPRRYVSDTRDSEAFKKMLRAAEKGDVASMYIVGMMYKLGDGTEVNDDESIKWLNRAATKNDEDAIEELVSYYMNTEEVVSDTIVSEEEDGVISIVIYEYTILNSEEPDTLEAQKYFEMAVKNNLREIICHYGWCYYNGDGFRKDYGKALTYFEKAANLGDSTAMNYIGIMYEDGIGVEQSYDKAFEWFNKASEHGNGNGDCNLAVLYEFGRGVEKDMTKAVFLYRRSVDRGTSEANYYLGNLTLEGKGVTKDGHEALKLFLKAADNGYTLGYVKAAFIYQHGLAGVNVDYAKATQYFKTGIKKGSLLALHDYCFLLIDQKKEKEANEMLEACAKYNHPPCIGWLGVNYVEGRMCKKDIAKGMAYLQKAATLGDTTAMLNLGTYLINGIESIPLQPEVGLKWYMEAANAGMTQAEYAIGQLYEVGNGVDQDYHEAVNWYMKAAKKGNHNAQNNLGHLYSKGHGVKLSMEKAIMWGKKAAESGDALSIHNVAVYYDYGGQGMKPNKAEALVWYKKASEAGMVESTNMLGYKYEIGEGVEKDPKQAFHYYSLAANLGFPKGMANLALAYYRGLGVPVDLPKAIEWLEKAAELEDSDAQFILGDKYMYGDVVKVDKQKGMELIKKSAAQGNIKAINRLEYLKSK